MLLFVFTLYYLFTFVCIFLPIKGKNTFHNSSNGLSECIFYSALIFLFSHFAVLFYILSKDARTLDNTLLKFREFSTHRLFIAKYSFMYFSLVLVFKFIITIFNPHIIHDDKHDKRSIWKEILSFVFVYLGIFLLIGTLWAKGRFPMDDTTTVYYTLITTTDIEDVSIIRQSIFLLVGTLLTTGIIFSIGIYFRHETKAHCVSFDLFKKKHFFSFHSALLIISGVFFLFCFSCSFFLLHGKEYIPLYKSSRIAIDSEFYKKEYIDPQNTTITFPERKRNLIIILMESMESSYSSTEQHGLMNENLISNLSALALQNTNFSNTETLGGGIDLFWHWMDNRCNDREICRTSI